MNRRFLTLLAFGGLVCLGFMLAEELSAKTLPGNIVEKHVNANLLRISLDGNWQEVPLMPLADSACQSGDEHLERYCE